MHTEAHQHTNKSYNVRFIVLIQRPWIVYYYYYYCYYCVWGNYCQY